MADKRDLLAENIFLYSKDKPTKDDADQNGYVLYFCPEFGWYSGTFMKAHMPGTTHWTYLPLRPPALPDPAIARDQQFDDWLKTFPTKFEDCVIALFRHGWNAGWARASSR